MNFLGEIYNACTYLGCLRNIYGGIAVIAKQLGCKVTGSDANVYPPMSTMLAEQGIEIIEGYDENSCNRLLI